MPTADRAALRGRIRILALGVAAWTLLVLLRLADLQILRADEMRDQAGNQQEAMVRLDARRGVIYDRAGRELAVSVEVESIAVDPVLIDDPARAVAQLAPALGLTRMSEREELIGKIAEHKAKKKRYLRLKRKVEPEVAAAVRALRLPGIQFEREHKRFYPNGTLAAHVLGFSGMENVGMEGMELTLDKRIRGHDGRMFVVGDARGHKFQKVMRREPVPGHSVTLTLDETIQHIAERELAEAVDRTGAASASVIVMEPATGDILAMASYPSFNPNHAGRFDLENRRNRAVTDAYEPGSTFKIVTMAAALEKGLLRTSDWFDCQNGAIRVSGVTLHDHKPFGSLSATEVLQESSNVGAIKIGLRVPDADFYQQILRFGFGTKTGIELPAESRGLLREPSEWSGISKATLSFGQELSVSPLQLITAVAAVANGGELRLPRLVLRETDDQGLTVSESPLRPSSRVISKSTAATLRQMMNAVVERGTAKAARMPGYSVAGKTGTAQKIGPDGTYRGNRYVASFVGFVPTSRPALAILVVLDEPRGALYHGGDIAAPVFQRIALPALRYLGVPPEAGRHWMEGDDRTLVAHAHARRWIHPVPLDEKERMVELAREEKERSRRRRQKEKEKDDDGPSLPSPRPLPAAKAVTTGDHVLVADLQGHSIRRAVLYLGRVGLMARVEFPEDGQEGVVVEQVPPAGTVVPRGTEVIVRPGRYLPEPVPKEEAAEPGDRGPADSVVPARRSIR